MPEHRVSDRPERALEGIGAFAWKLSLGTLVAIVGVVVVLSLRGTPTAPAAPTEAPADRDAVREPRPARGSPDVPGVAVTAVGVDVERRHAAGELAEAQRRFEPCPGGDVRRVAWIDAQQRVRKLVHYRSGGAVVEQWFDDAGRLREGLVRTTAGGRAWTRRIGIDERGAESVVDAPGGAVPDEPPPALVRSDPGSAFFGGPGCLR